jgi:translation initiation factor IF-1
VPRDDLIEIDGVILDAMGGGKYKVQTQVGDNTPTTSLIIAQLSGRLRNNHIRVLPGDRVTVGVSPYDLTNGIITYRGDKRPRR